MTRTMQKRISRTSPVKRLLRPALTAAALGAGFLALTAAAPAARADGVVYQQHTVNAGVLVLTTDPAPFLFYVLNKRPDVRPAELTFVNPLAPAAATPDTAAYWEVSLSNVSESELARYDILYLLADHPPYSPAINEKLRRFVDGGGQLVVEYGAASAPVQGLFIGSKAVSQTTAPVAFPTTGAAAVLQPILAQPFLFTGTDLTNLGGAALALGPSTTDLVHQSEFSVFSPALVTTNGPAVSTTQIGAGQVIVSALNFGPAIGATNLPASAPTAGLKLLANIAASAEAHPNGSRTSHGNSSGRGLASFSPAWQAPVSSSGTVSAPGGAAVWGNFVFVTDAAGTLHAYDAYPSENLTGTANTDGKEQVTGVSQYPNTSYDEIWNTASASPALGAGASAPIVAAVSGTNYVFVEKPDGSVVGFNAVTGTAFSPALMPPAVPPPPATYTVQSYPAGGVTNAPAPTYYDGRLYAGQANGSLAVYNLTMPGVMYFVPLNPTPPTGASEPVTGPPSVGLISGGDANVLIAMVPTPYNMYTVLLGARNEPLKPFSVGGTLNGYSINRTGRYDVANLFAETAFPAPQLYDADGVNQNIPLSLPLPNAQDPLFTTSLVGSFFTDWNMNFTFAAGTNAGMTNPVNLNFISALSYGEVNGPATPASAMSAPALDRRGDAYYTETISSGSNVNSYVVGVATAPLHSYVHLKFRFRLPTAADGANWNYMDADSVNYTGLVGYTFSGPPVADDQGNVYAVATKPAATVGGNPTATVLCFRGNQSVSAVLPTPSSVDLTTTTVSQPDEGGSTEDNSIFRGPDTNIGAANATYGQFIGTPTTLTFYNFGKRGSTFSQIAGSLTEPQPVTATDTLGSGTKTQLLMRTNLAWYVQPFSVQGTITGLSRVGTSLFFSDGVSLFRLSANPAVGSGRVVTAAPVGAPLGTSGSGLGAVGAPPSAGGSVLVVSGTAGIAALTRQVTVVADSGRVIGVDGDGGAVWAVDATSQTDPASGATTKVAFSHPSSLSQFAPNDYLAADPGANRCVRFDPGGAAHWELTRFSDDLYGILASGQPLTLSQPSSVVSRIVPDTDTNNPGGSYNYYLVADSGNNRIVEICDRVNAAGGIFTSNLATEVTLSHVLTWATHTGDRDGRAYRYGSAAYYPNPSPLTGKAPYSIAATVANTQIGPLAAPGKLGPVSSDAPGGSIAVFNPPATPQKYSAGPTADLAYVAAGFQTYDGTAYKAYSVRNPRFLQLYTPPVSAGAVAPNANVAAFDFLYADDNGAFDLTYDTPRKAFVAGPDRLRFISTDYKAMSQTAFGVGGTVSRGNRAFVPVSVQALSTDSQGAGLPTTRRYLITQGTGQGELGSPVGGRLGGEVFEVDAAGTSTTGTNSGVGGFSGGQTLAHPGFTGPLLQPGGALRLP